MKSSSIAANSLVERGGAGLQQMAVPKVTRSYTAGFREKHKIVEIVQKLGALSEEFIIDSSVLGYKGYCEQSPPLCSEPLQALESTASKLPEVSSCCLCGPSGRPPLGIEEAHSLSTRNSAKSARRK